MFPADKDLHIVFAHGAYQMSARFDARKTGIKHTQVRNFDDLAARVGEADIVCVSMMWKNDLIAKAPRLKFIQSISAGLDQYDQAALRAAKVRLASAAGVNAVPVAEHALAMMLALNRLIHTGRDHQAQKHWRPMISDIGAREAELYGKTVAIVGLGRIGGRIAKLAKAFDMHVIGVKRDIATPQPHVDELVATAHLPAALAKADIVVLACPLTKDTENLVDTRAFSAMKPGAQVINVARGKVVDETALITALQSGHVASAGLDVTREEPMPSSSPLWGMPNVLITPHTAGETRAYEDRVVDLLIDNVRCLQRGEKQLLNDVC